VTTYSSLFNTNPFFSNPGVIIVDDAHAAENYIASLWTLPGCDGALSRGCGSTFFPVVLILDCPSVRLGVQSGETLKSCTMIITEPNEFVVECTIECPCS
jgi:hypothetical protein